MTKLEPEYAAPFAAWKAKPEPATAATIMQALAPTVAGAVRYHLGDVHPLVLGRARLMALDALGSYDPTKGRLNTHIYNHLQGLKRVNRQELSGVRAPERLTLERRRLLAAEQELSHTLGREPTDDELSDAVSLPHERIARIRRSQIGAPSSAFEAGDEEGPGSAPATRQSGANLRSHWQQAIYDELDPYHQKVMELGLGLHGRDGPMENQEIARRLRRSPGAISQAKARIQAKLDEGFELSPFDE